MKEELKVGRFNEKAALERIAKMDMYIYLLFGTEQEKRAIKLRDALYEFCYKCYQTFEKDRYTGGVFGPFSYAMFEIMKEEIGELKYEENRK